MVQKVILAVALIGVLFWAVTCGRSRTAQPSDTPVPTLTPLTTTAAAAAQTPTAAPIETPAEEPSPSAEVEATAGAPVTTTEAVLATATVTDGAVVTESATITATEAITESEAITDSVAVTASMTMTEAVPATAPDATIETEAVTETASVAETDTVTEPAPITEPAAETITETEAIETPATVTAEPTATPRATATPMATVMPTAALTETAELTGTAEATATTERPSPPSDVELPRRSITLPTDLPMSVQIGDVTVLTDLIADALPSLAELSPDGNSVAWLVAEQARRPASLCVASLSNGGQNCLPVTGYSGMPYRLVWSPDGAWLAFSEDPSAQALESDIWLFDVAQRAVINRTDDGASGRYVDVEGEFALDYLPMWDASTGYLYFWRSVPDEAGGFGLQLMRLDPAGSEEAELVRDLGQELGDGMVRFGWQRFYLHGPSAIAPDGSQIAVAVAPAQEMDLSSSHALWLIDLEDEEAAPQQVATALAWQTALPQWANQPAVVRGLQWAADGAGIVVAALSSDLRLPLLLAYHVDVESGEVTPVVDFSDSRDRDAFFRVDPSTGHALRFDVPWTMALAPNANVLLMVTDLGGVVRVLGAPLPPSGGALMTLHEHRSPGYEPWTRSSSGDDRVLVYGLLMESQPRE